MWVIASTIWILNYSKFLLGKLLLKKLSQLDSIDGHEENAYRTVK